MKKSIYIATILMALGLVLTTSGFGQTMATGGFKPIEKTDPGADLAASFAVKERSAKTKKKILLGEIFRAEDKEPMLGARDFRLCLKVTAKGKQSFAQAIVSMGQYSNLKLLSWVKSTCGGN